MSHEKENKSMTQPWLRWTWIDEGYLKRLPIIPRNRFFNVYLHRYFGPDSRAEGLHDHPWSSLSIRLWGKGFGEWRPASSAEGIIIDRVIEKGKVIHVALGGGFANTNYKNPKWILLRRFVFRRAEDAHAIATGHWPVWTLFFTGPRRREWGFYTDEGWVKADEVFARKTQTTKEN